MDFSKTYDKIRTRMVIRNFFIAFSTMFLVLNFFNLFDFMEKDSISHIIGLSITQGFMLIFIGHNLFQRNDFSKSIKNLKVQFPHFNDAVFYAILFSRLQHSKYSDQPILAIKKIKRVYSSLLLKTPELNPNEVKMVLEYLYP